MYIAKKFTNFPPLRQLSLNTKTLQAAADGLFDVVGYEYSGTLAEGTRAARRVRIGAVQNCIVKPTSDPIIEQVIPGMNYILLIFEVRPKFSMYYNCVVDISHVDFS